MKKFDRAATATETKPPIPRIEHSRAVLWEVAATWAVTFIGGLALSLVFHWRVLDVLAGSVVFAVAFWYLSVAARSETVSKLLNWIITFVLYRRLGDAPEPREPTLTLEVVDPSGLKMRRLPKLPCTEEQLWELARGLVNGKSFSQAEWTGSGKPLSRSKFKKIQDTFVARGMAYWRNPQHTTQGVKLTAWGKSVVREIVCTQTSARRGSGLRMGRGGE